MSITIIIGTQSILIHNHTQNVLSCIYKLKDEIKEGSELIIFICDPETSNFHKYEFDYSLNLKLSPKKWLLNSLLYSLNSDKTRIDMKDLFNDILIELNNEYNKSQN